jgi:hypothetical protein
MLWVTNQGLKKKTILLMYHFMALTWAHGPKKQRILINLRDEFATLGAIVVSMKFTLWDQSKP